MTFQDALEKHFKFFGGYETDNLPILATARFRWGRDGDFGRNALAKMMGDMGYLTGAEIGTHRGVSAKLWCKENPHLHLTCVDPYRPYKARPSQVKQDSYYASAIRRLRPYEATIVRKTSMDAVGAIEDASLDFVFIDGDHRFDPVMQDLICWARKVRRGGMVMLHDYFAFRQSGVMKAIDAYAHCHRIDPWYTTRDHMPTAFWLKGDERCP